MREPPMLRAELNGAVVRRPGVLDVLVCDLIGKPVVSHLRPQLEEGEQLRERVGQIPEIVRTAA